MANESVYVAIGIACVMALVMLGIFLVYCVKRHQEKVTERRIRERRAREERQRRHLMRGQIVRPPPYETNTLPHYSDLDRGLQDNPYSPPPAYKEIATPLPGQSRSCGVGIGGVANYGYDHEIPTVSRNVAPANTHYSLPQPVITDTPRNSTNNNNNIDNNNINNNTRNRNIRRTTSVQSDSTIQVEVSPHTARDTGPTVLPDVVTSNTNYSNNQNTPANSNMSRRLNMSIAPSHATRNNPSAITASSQRSVSRQTSTQHNSHPSDNPRIQNSNNFASSFANQSQNTNRTESVLEDLSMI